MKVHTRWWPLLAPTVTSEGFPKTTFSFDHLLTGFTELMGATVLMTTFTVGKGKKTRKEEGPRAKSARDPSMALQGVLSAWSH